MRLLPIRTEAMMDTDGFLVPQNLVRGLQYEPQQAVNEVVQAGLLR